MVDVVIVLSHRLENKNNSSEYQKRLEKGIDEFKKYNANYIVLCSETANSFNLNQLIIAGIHKSSILLQSRSKDTIGEAIFCKKVIPKDCKNILVVSSDYHIYYRAALIFDCIFGPTYNMSYSFIDTKKIRKLDIILDQVKSLKLFFKNFSLSKDIENQLYLKHKLYKKEKHESK